MARARDFLGPYRLSRLIRVGQGTQVWEAVNQREEKRYALKILQRDYLDNKEEIQRLKHEFQVIGDIKHPNIIRVYEFNTESDVPFLVMELFESKNFKIALREGVEAIAPKLKEIIEQAADGLFYLHEKGWVHRDVKPDNFLLGETEKVEVKLIDFSIAERQRKGLMKLFGRPKVAGTRSYMSPEQIRGEALDARADVYSFGCTLFELVAGRPPFTGSSPSELLEKHLHAAAPSVMAMNKDVTQEFADLIGRTMAKKADGRPPSMWEFLREFRQIKIFRTIIKRRPTDTDEEQDG